ncbi:MAG: hypothetical protein GXO89_07190 [Chlorobi bacterium]|nr:hypothetical protein [Chlorobiota bacterium]
MAKAIDVEELKKTQEKNEQVPCPMRKIRKPSPISVHMDIGSDSLPLKTRNKLFFHYHHYCAVLGCRYAPVKEIQKIINDYPDFIFVLPRLEKGNIKKIESSFNSLCDKYLKKNNILTWKSTVGDAINDTDFRKYYELEQGLAFLFSKKLKGKRHSGLKDKILLENTEKTITIKRADDSNLPPLFICNNENDRAILISAISSELNQMLIRDHITINNLEIDIK